jgi:hypothetical protein
MSLLNFCKKEPKGTHCTRRSSINPPRSAMSDDVVISPFAVLTQQLGPASAVRLEAAPCVAPVPPPPPVPPPARLAGGDRPPGGPSQSPSETPSEVASDHRALCVHQYNGSWMGVRTAQLSRLLRTTSSPSLEEESKRSTPSRATDLEFPSTSVGPPPPPWLRHVLTRICGGSKGREDEEGNSPKHYQTSTDLHSQ